MKIRIIITLKSGVLDPQGTAIFNALNNMNYNGINDIRQGKVIDINIDDAHYNEGKIHDMCRELLVNGVIENYEFSAITEG